MKIIDLTNKSNEELLDCIFSIDPDIVRSVFSVIETWSKTAIELFLNKVWGKLDEDQLSDEIGNHWSSYFQDLMGHFYMLDTFHNKPKFGLWVQSGDLYLVGSNQSGDSFSFHEFYGLEEEKLYRYIRMMRNHWG